MAIPSRQIGWSTKSNLLWEISKQLEALTGVIGRNIPATTTTSTTSTTSTTTTAAPFIDTIIISNGSLSITNGTYTRNSPSSGFTQVGGPSFIFNAAEDGWYINSGSGNAAKNTSELGTGTWVPWVPGSSSGITAEYFYNI